MGHLDFATAQRSPYRAHIVSVRGTEPTFDGYVDVLVPDHLDNIKDEVLVLAMRELHKKGIAGSLDAGRWRVRCYERQS